MTATAYLALLVALLVAIAALAAVLTRRRRPARDAFLLAGPSGGGKTTLFVKLRYGKAVPCYPSIKENEGTFPPHSSPDVRPLHVVDLPGHPQLRFLTSQFLPIAAGVVFVVDSSSFSKSVRETAEALYDVLADPRMPRNLLVACNKQDLWTSWGWERVKEELEKELDSLRATRTASVSTLSPEASSEYLGVEGQPFAFDQLDCAVEFAEIAAASADREEEGLEKVVDWMEGVRAGR
ncbi:signal recognition particle receptor beta subunit-domain-containing protein [Hyaloraphidium curvatum]|nr:signal recognition particle receptor beta subunit-domain-containing protein [Hyaloraphidium curvatum]